MGNPGQVTFESEQRNGREVTRQTVDGNRIMDGAVPACRFWTGKDLDTATQFGQAIDDHEGVIGNPAFVRRIGPSEDNPVH